MIKFGWYYDIDKEELFLNKMSKRGYYLVKYGYGFYKFKKINETDYTYRIDLISDKDPKEQQEYFQLLDESGAELIQTWFNTWAYFRKKGRFELYTDNDSQINFYNRISALFLSGTLLEAIVAFYQWGIYLGQGWTFCLVAGIFLSFATIVTSIQSIKFSNKVKTLKKANIK